MYHTLDHLFCSIQRNIDLKCLYNSNSLHFMQYSLFGSILTIGAMIGAIISGSVADYAGRRVVGFSNFVYSNFKLNVSCVLFIVVPIFGYFAKQAMGFSEVCCILGWLAIAFSKVDCFFDFISLPYSLSCLHSSCMMFLIINNPVNYISRKGKNLHEKSSV